MKMNMMWSGVALAALMSTAALADTQAAAPGQPSPGDWKQQRMERKEERREERVQAIKTALQVDANGGAKVDQILASAQEKRKALHQEMKSNFDVVRRAAGGDATAMNQVDQAVAKLRADKAQMGTLNDQLYDQLSQGRSPQQKASLVIAMVGFGDHGGHGRHGGRGRQ